MSELTLPTEYRLVNDRREVPRFYLQFKVTGKRKKFRTFWEALIGRPEHPLEDFYEWRFVPNECHFYICNNIHDCPTWITFEGGNLFVPNHLSYCYYMSCFVGQEHFFGSLLSFTIEHPFIEDYFKRANEKRRIREAENLRERNRANIEIKPQKVLGNGH